MPATQQDIADRLNLSRSLVGGVLSNHPTLRVSKETRDRVQQAAIELGYRPNSVASNLRRGKTGVVTLVYRNDPGQSNGAAFGEVMSALATRVSHLSHEFHIRPFNSQESLLSGLREMASRSQCDAIVLWVEHGGEAAGELLESLKFPFIIKGRHEERHPNWLQADFDHEALMSMAVEHLVAGGHQRIGYIGPDAIEDYSYFQRRGYKSAMLNLGFDPNRWHLTVPEGPEIVDREMSKLFAFPPLEQPTAMVVGASMAAWNGLELALARRGRKLGIGKDDFAAVGGRHYSPLLFGEAMAYDQLELADIANSIGGLLQRLLSSEGPTTDGIVRLVPQLHHQPSFRLPVGNFESYAGPFWPARWKASL